MCMQCMATAVTSGAAVTGIRSWLATRSYSWLTPRLLKRATIGLIAMALIASSLVASGSAGTAAAGASAPTQASSAR